MEIKDEDIKGMVNKEDWKKWVDLNTDEYGKACIDCARACMYYLDNIPTKLVKGYAKMNTAHGIICHAGEGLSGFMASCVVSMVQHCHIRGEEFYNSYNQE